MSCTHEDLESLRLISEPMSDTQTDYCRCYECGEYVVATISSSCFTENEDCVTTRPMTQKEISRYGFDEPTESQLESYYDLNGSTPSERAEQSAREMRELKRGAA